MVSVTLQLNRSTRQPKARRRSVLLPDARVTFARSRDRDRRRGYGLVHGPMGWVLVVEPGASAEQRAAGERAVRMRNKSRGRLGRQSGRTRPRRSPTTGRPAPTPAPRRLSAPRARMRAPRRVGRVAVARSSSPPSSRGSPPGSDGPAPAEPPRPMARAAEWRAA